MVSQRQAAFLISQTFDRPLTPSEQAALDAHLEQQPETRAAAQQFTALQELCRFATEALEDGGTVDSLHMSTAVRRRVETAL